MRLPRIGGARRFSPTALGVFAAWTPVFRYRSGTGSFFPTTARPGSLCDSLRSRILSFLQLSVANEGWVYRASGLPGAPRRPCRLCPQDGIRHAGPRTCTARRPRPSEKLIVVADFGQICARHYKTCLAWSWDKRTKTCGTSSRLVVGDDAPDILLYTGLNVDRAMRLWSRCRTHLSRYRYELHGH